MPKPLTTKHRASSGRKHADSASTKIYFVKVKTLDGYVWVREGQRLIDAKEVDRISPNSSVSFVKVNDELKILVSEKNGVKKYQHVIRNQVNNESVSRRGRRASFLRGVGSTLDIYPDVNYGDFVPKQSAAERMRGHFENTGRNIYRALKKVEVENE